MNYVSGVCDTFSVLIFSFCFVKFACVNSLGRNNEPMSPSYKVFFPESLMVLFWLHRLSLTTFQDRWGDGSLRTLP